MLTRAKVIESADNNKGYKWWVNIPILNGIPDNESEGESQRKLYNAKVQTNSLLKEEDQKSKTAIVKETYEDWDTRALKFNGSNSNGDKVDSWNFYNQREDFLTQASVCGIGGISNYINVGDTVIVGFEDNDMGKPIILGHLLTQKLEENRDTYPSLNLQSLKVIGNSNGFNDNTSLPNTTKFKFPDGSVITITQLQDMLNFYKMLSNDFPAASLISLLQKLSGLLPPTTPIN